MAHRVFFAGLLARKGLEMARQTSWRDRKEQRAGGCLVRALAIGVLLVLLVGAVLPLWTGPAPAVTLKPGLPGIGRRTPIAVADRRHRPAHRGAGRGGPGERTSTLVAERSFEPRPAWAFWRAATPLEITVDVGRETVKGLRAGTATVRVTAERAGHLAAPARPGGGRGRSCRCVSRRPRLGLLSSQHYVAQGGCEVVVYRVGESAVRDGVRSGSWWFPGFRMPGARQAAALRPLRRPLRHLRRLGVRLIAVDDVGNEAAVAFVDQFFPKPIGTDTIQLSDAFLAQGRAGDPVAVARGRATRADLLANYLAINGDLRRQERRDAARSWPRKSAPPLPLEPGLPADARTPPSRAAFADRRTYIYNGKPVDQQDHLGFDMASVERDAIPASNRGVVVLARYFGIYGNAVVVDHGYGLMSLYGHLSSIDGQGGADGRARPGPGPLGPDRPRRRRPPALHHAPPGARRSTRSSGGTRTGSRTASRRKLGPALQLAPAG